MQILILELEGVCGGGSSQRFACTFNNNVVSVTCSFDGGEEEDCSLPLVVTTDIFGTDDHFVVLTATDEFIDSVSEFHFSFAYKCCEYFRCISSGHEQFFTCS